MEIHLGPHLGLFRTPTLPIFPICGDLNPSYSTNEPSAPQGPGCPLELPGSPKALPYSLLQESHGDLLNPCCTRRRPYDCV